MSSTASSSSLLSTSSSLWSVLLSQVINRDRPSGMSITSHSTVAIITIIIITMHINIVIIICDQHLAKLMYQIPPLLQSCVCVCVCVCVCTCMCVCVCVCVCVCMCVCVCVVHLYCSAQLSMFNMEKRYRNKIIIIYNIIIVIIIIIIITIIIIIIIITIIMIIIITKTRMGEDLASTQNFTKAYSAFDEHNTAKLF